MRIEYLILTLVSLTVPILATAQSDKPEKTTKVELLHANSLEYDESIAPKTRRLIGDVSFKHDNAVMHCDSAYMYSLTNSLDAFRNVHIIESDTVNIWGDELNYNGNTKMAIITGEEVILDDSKMKLTTDRLVYDMNQKFGKYTTGGTIVDKENILTSIYGYYYEEKNEFFFKDSVVLRNPKYTIYADTLMYNTTTEIAYFYGPTRIYSEENLIYCETGWYNTITDQSEFSENSFMRSDKQVIWGDSIFYDRAVGYGNAKENVIIVDTVQDVIVYGDYAEYFEEREVTIVTGNTFMKQKFDEDTLYLHSDTLRTELDSIGSENRTLFAYHKVKMYKSDMQGMCDSLVYSYSDSTIKMFTAPILWTDSNQLTADTIHILIANDKVNKMHLINTSFITSREDSTYYNQIKGKKMVGHFKDDKLHKVDVFGNGQTVYYVSEEGSTDVDNVNTAASSDLIIYVDSNKVSKITFMTQPDATLYPIGEAPKEELILKGFAWHGKHRPLKIEDIFKWDVIETRKSKTPNKNLKRKGE